MKDSEEALLRSATLQVRLMGYRKREVSGLRQLFDRFNLHRRPEPVSTREKRGASK